MADNWGAFVPGPKRFAKEATSAGALGVIAFALAWSEGLSWSGRFIVGLTTFTCIVVVLHIIRQALRPSESPESSKPGKHAVTSQMLTMWDTDRRKLDEQVAANVAMIAVRDGALSESQQHKRDSELQRSSIESYKAMTLRYSNLLKEVWQMHNEVEQERNSLVETTMRMQNALRGRLRPSLRIDDVSRAFGVSPWDQDPGFDKVPAEDRVRAALQAFDAREPSPKLLKTVGKKLQSAPSTEAPTSPSDES